MTLRTSITLALALALVSCGDAGDGTSDSAASASDGTSAGPTTSSSGSPATTSEDCATGCPDPGTSASSGSLMTTDPSTGSSSDGGESATTGPGSTGESATGDTSGTGTGTSTSGATETDGTTGDVIPDCQDDLPNPAGQEVVIAPEFEEFYTTYDLGPVPGVPDGALLGGCTIAHDDPDTLLIAGDSEQPDGKIYSIGVVRGPCGNIIGFNGLATPIVDAPYVDANLTYGPKTILFYTHWPVNQVSQLLPGQNLPVSTTSMGPLGINEDQGVSGLGFVPPNLNDPAGLRVLTWSAGNWYHVDYVEQNDHYALQNPVKTATLPNGPGGFAYVPAESPGFDAQSVIVAEWSNNTVAVYEVDGQGDPTVATRKDFFTVFPRPWGAYFEPIKGDFMFLTWGAPNLDDRVYIVQGFEQPPPIPQ
ncbi:MAG: hypothetical protein H6713_38980 [Myxococcales bacterium]|nr:hypothetical protein [Myxococcales bacterium]